jgi:hypothetical protein
MFTFKLFTLKPVLFQLCQGGLLSMMAIVPLTIAPSAHAQSACIMMDINFQMGMRGTQAPSVQQNDVSMNANDDCYSGASVTHSSQTAVSPGPITQIRSSESTIDSQKPAAFGDMPGFGGPAIKVPVNVQVDIYNPALDNTFQSGMSF